jgi:hypothetical protein
MKEKGVDGAEVGGFKAAEDGWHKGEMQQGIDYMKGKGGEGVWQDEKTGQHAYNFPIKIVDSEDPSDGANIGWTAFEKSGGNALATLLTAVGMWDAICAKFPGDNVSVFDKPIMDGIKAKLPGRSCMVLSQVDKQGYAKAIKFASFAKYKEIQAEEKTKAATSKKGKAAAPAETTPAAETGAAGNDGW